MIKLTKKASDEIKRLLGGKQDHLRIQIIAAGCSGLSYKLGFETSEPTEHDKVFEQDGIKVVVDKKSLLFLSGTELNFSDGLNGTGFTFENPNATHSCGCGNSFST